MNIYKINYHIENVSYYCGYSTGGEELIKAESEEKAKDILKEKIDDNDNNLIIIDKVTLVNEPINIYEEYGYNNREEYLDSLKDEYDEDVVDALAEVLGPPEDFDGLITMLEDYYGGY